LKRFETVKRPQAASENIKRLDAESMTGKLAKGFALDIPSSRPRPQVVNAGKVLTAYVPSN
jgi:hypothetical protein